MATAAHTPAMDCSGVHFSGHALRRMFERGVGAAAIRGVVRFGEVVDDYPDDTPFPSCLLLGEGAGEPLHVVVARNPVDSRCYIITVYWPDPDLWEPGFKVRKR